MNAQLIAQIATYIYGHDLSDDEGELSYDQCEQLARDIAQIVDDAE